MEGVIGIRNAIQIKVMKGEQDEQGGKPLADDDVLVLQAVDDAIVIAPTQAQTKLKIKQMDQARVQGLEQLDVADLLAAK
ncbi:hypothetical protein ACFLQI_00485 [Candidatus Undinarchaeota archaeon]